MAAPKEPIPLLLQSWPVFGELVPCQQQPTLLQQSLCREISAHMPRAPKFLVMPLGTCDVTSLPHVPLAKKIACFIHASSMVPEAQMTLSY